MARYFFCCCCCARSVDGGTWSHYAGVIHGPGTYLLDLFVSR
jgi:hypothetical protein